MVERICMQIKPTAKLTLMYLWRHVHLLISSDKAVAIGVMMKALGQRYVQYINRSYRRSGTLWEGRYRSCPTQVETYLFTCQCYIELNPVRANIVTHPAEYHLV